MAKTLEELKEENAKLIASIEIYAFHSKEMSRLNNQLGRLVNQVPELQRSLNTTDSRLTFLEDTLDKMGQFLVKRSGERK